MKRLVATRTKTLDTTLYRAKLDQSVLARFHSERKGCIRWHPLVGEVLRRNSLVLKWDRLWTASFRSDDGKDKFRFSELAEINENAMDPPFSAVRIQIWPSSLPTVSDYQQDTRSIVTGTRNEQGELQAVTVEQLIKHLLQAVEGARQATGLGEKLTDEIVRRIISLAWRTKDVDQDGCLCLGTKG